jgi:hypothetical protein
MVAVNRIQPALIGMAAKRQSEIAISSELGVARTITSSDEKVSMRATIIAKRHGLYGQG